MDPCRPATGRQGVFAKFRRAGRSSEGPVARPPGDRTLSPGGRATGTPVARWPGDRPPAPYKMCLPPTGRSFGARNFQKKERGVGKVKRRSPAGFLACDL